MPVRNGTSGNDTLNFTGNADNWTIDGGAGNDYIAGGIAADKLLGGLGNDSLVGGAGHDTLSGGAGSDVINGGTGRDFLYGGTGNDTFNFKKGDLDWNGLNGGDTIHDFQGAGKLNAPGVDNDFVRFTGFEKATAFFTYDSSSMTQSGLHYYKVGDASGWSWLAIKNMPGEDASAKLGAMDYVFV